jgi:hypothetical protein
MLTALGVSRPVEFVSQKDRIDLVVQSMEVMARAAEANGQAEFDVDQFRRYK